MTLGEFCEWQIYLSSAVNILQCCQTRLLSVAGQKQAPSTDKHDIPKSGSSESNNTTRNILLAVGALAVGAGVYYVSFISLEYNGIVCGVLCAL